MVRETPIHFENQGAQLAGTLYRPAGIDHPPVVVVLHYAVGGLRSSPFYRHLVERLPAAGIGVLLYDRRGSGESSGVFATADFGLLAADAAAGVNALGLQGIPLHRVFLYGISQGAWIAPLLARRMPQLAGLVIVSSSGVSPAAQMNYSAAYALRRAGFDDEVVGRALQLRARVDEWYRGRLAREAIQPELDRAAREPWFEHAFLDAELPTDPRVDKWYYEMDYEPLAVWEALRQPALFLFAEDDEWVPVDESLRLYQSVTGHNRVARFERIAGTNHLMAPPGAPPEEGVVSEDYLRILLGWLQERVEHLQE